MKIKVGNDYLDFDADIEIEKKAKLFEEISSTQGDFSYSFELQRTIKNESIFELWSANENNKRIYSRIPAVIENDGQALYSGYIVVESKLNVITCSFFSGNNNWIALIKGKVKDLDISEYDENLTADNITDKFGNLTGIIYPVINTGTLNTRSYISWNIEDFHPFIYVHDIIKRIFVNAGLKLKGDLLTDWTYKHLITTNGSIETPESELTGRSIKVGVDIDRVFDASNDDAIYVIPFDQTTSPYYIGTKGNWTNYKYTADVQEVVNIKLLLDIEEESSPNPILINPIIMKNGSEILIEQIDSVRDKDYRVILEINNIKLNPGDYIEGQIGHSVPEPENGFFIVPLAELTVTSTYIYKTFGVNLLPDQSQQEFVSQIFGMFNTIVSYDAFTKTVNIDFFKTVVRRPPIDISTYIDVSEVNFDYTDFISSYGKLNYFLYNESDKPEIKKYNLDNVNPYASGVIDSNNENAEPEVDVIELDVVAVIETIKNPLESFLPEVNFLELSEEEDITVTSVTDASGVAQFNVAGVNEGDLVRIVDSTVPSYNGDYVASAGDGTTYFRLRGVNYIADADLTVKTLRYQSAGNTDQIFLLSIPLMAVSGFSSKTGIYINESFTSNVATAYFYKPLQGLDIDAYKQSLSWGDVNIPNAYQLTLLDTFWKDFEKILQDPVKIIPNFLFPEVIFRQIDFTRPVYLKHKEFQGALVVNRITGYKNSYIQCEVELIKL